MAKQKQKKRRTRDLYEPRVGDLVEVTSGPYASVLGRVDSFRGRRVNLCRVQIADDYSETQCGLLRGVDAGTLCWMPPPASLMAGRKRLRNQNLADKRASDYIPRDERPSIRVVSARDLGLDGPGWET